MTATAASPVSVAVYGLLQDATLQAAVGGRLGDTLPEDVVLPCVWYEVFDETDIRGFGTGGLPEIDLRVHTFSRAQQMAEGQGINRQIVACLKDADLVVDGYAQCGKVVYRNTVQLADQAINGVACHETVSLFTVWCEEA